MSSVASSGRTNWPQKRAASVVLRPEREGYSLSWLDRGWRALRSRCLWPLQRRLWSPGRLAPLIIAESETLQALSDTEFRQRRQDVRQLLVREGINRQTIIPAFALVREAAGRSLGMRHHHTQIQASLIMLRGMVAEMATGEGKTLACTLAAATAALAGIRVHVVTTNDYLAERDCEDMLPLYQSLGLTAGALLNGIELPDRQRLYRTDILYTANNELVFDYLKDMLVLGERRHTVDVYRDSLSGVGNSLSGGGGVNGGNDAVTGRLMHRGLVFAIVDEADSVFIDESRTPLVISGGELPQADREEFLRQMLTFARTLTEDVHYGLKRQQRRLYLLTAGREALQALTGGNSDEGGMHWLQRARSEELLVQALTALHLFERDKHYIVGTPPGVGTLPGSEQDADTDSEGQPKVMIVDDYTGRVAPDRSWEGGLHQLIEIKEGCAITSPQKTLAKISYQQFFRKYFHLSGMTGTAHEVKDELYSVYGLLVCKVPLLRRSQRRLLRHRVYPTMAAKELAIVAAVQSRAARGQAVLVGTATVDQSERLAARLSAAGVDFELLTAKQDADEAGVVARAGESGRVTLATSMAGRGTDIKLSPATREAGGLHVIISELQDASRIDRQLEGRCARQGDPGTVEYLLSFEDPLVQVYGQHWYRLARPLFSVPWLGHWAGRRLQRYCQWRLERRHARERHLTQKSDEREKKMLAFLGDGKWG